MAVTGGTPVLPRTQLDSPADFHYDQGMAFRRYGTFTGGIDLPDDKLATLGMPIQPCPPPGRLHVPLSLDGLRSAEAIVTAGQHVQAGERIAQAPAGGIDIFAPLSGRVVGPTLAQVATLDGFVLSKAIEIDTSQSDPGPSAAKHPSPFDWRHAQPGALREHLAAGMIPTHRRNCQSLSEWIDQARAHRCTTLIANAMENQPYVCADHRMLVEHGREVLQGLAILGRAIEAQRILLAADQRRIGDYSQLLAAVKHYHITAVALPHKYPIGVDPLLVKVLTRRETPPGADTMATGSAVIDPATCLAVYHWSVVAARCTGRVLTVAGELAGRKGNFYVPFGTPCRHLVEGEMELIHGGPMAGMRCLARGVVTPATEAVLALAPLTPVRATPCIRCGWCTDHCPARLNVAALNDAFELGLPARARKLGAAACMECGVCSYICPACLPLSQRVKLLKRRLRAGDAPLNSSAADGTSALPGKGGAR
jgi:electron transport complex protein RnfC